MKTGSLWLATGIAFILFSACDKQRVADEYINIPQSGWSKDSVASILVPITKPEKGYNVYVNIRNNVDYAYSNLWLFMEVDGPTGKAERDTIECILADAKGEWLGRGWGGIQQLRLPYKFNVHFKDKGSYIFRIQQGMRANPLKGIENVGIRVEYSN